MTKACSEELMKAWVAAAEEKLEAGAELQAATERYQAAHAAMKTIAAMIDEENGRPVA